MAGSFYGTGPDDTKARLTAAARPSGSDPPGSVDHLARAGVVANSNRLDAHDAHKAQTDAGIAGLQADLASHKAEAGARLDALEASSDAPDSGAGKTVNALDSDPQDTSLPGDD